MIILLVRIIPHPMLTDTELAEAEARADKLFAEAEAARKVWQRKDREWLDAAMKVEQERRKREHAHTSTAQTH